VNLNLRKSQKRQKEKRKFNSCQAEPSGTCSRPLLLPAGDLPWPPSNLQPPGHAPLPQSGLLPPGGDLYQPPSSLQPPGHAPQPQSRFLSPGMTGRLHKWIQIGGRQVEIKENKLSPFFKQMFCDEINLCQICIVIVTLYC
jgi:hypothetical protein